MLTHRRVEPHQGMLLQVFDARRLAVALDVLAARVDRPERVADLAPDQRFVVGVARAQRDVGLAFREVEILVAGDELQL